MERFHEAFAAVFKQEYDAMFSKATCPMLMVSPEHDLLMPYFQRLCDKYPEAKSVVLPECGIYAMDNEPKLIVKEIERFLGGIEAR
jgi:pimeloyl-ACP methyl ester carboxylesterase